MEEKVYFKIASIGGYNKNDVKKYLGDLQEKFDELKMENAAQLLKAEREYQALEEKYHALNEERDCLKKESEDFHVSKETIIKLELDAHMRAKTLQEQTHQEVEETLEQAKEEAQLTIEQAKQEAQLTMEQAKEEAANILGKAQQEAIAIKENYVVKAQADLKSIKSVQEELDSLINIITVKNKAVQEHIEEFDATMQSQ